MMPLSARERTLLAQHRAELDEWERRDRMRLFDHAFPDHTHVWRGRTFHDRSQYPRHLAFFAATAKYLEVAFMAANRSGKTFAGGFAVACWLTGIYPNWWQGRRFPGPVEIWVAGKTKATTRDILQQELLGRVKPDDAGASRRMVDGTGLIPGAMIRNPPSWHGSGVADAVDTVEIRHISGGISYLGFKSYEQGRSNFEGTAKDVVWFDEECPIDVLGEATTRLMTRKGLMMHTFTPLAGMSSVAKRFVSGSKEI